MVEKNILLKFSSNIDKKTKSKLYLLLPLILLGAFLELFLLILVPVFVDYFTSNLENSAILNFLNSLSNKYFNKQLIFDLKKIITVLLVFAIFKFLFDCFLTIFQTRVIFNFKNTLQKNLLKKYLNYKVKFFKNKNTSLLVRNLTTEIGFILARILYPSMIIFVNSIVLLFFIVFLCFYNIKIFFYLLILVLILFYFIKKLTYKLLKKNSNLQQFHDGGWIKNSQEIFGAIREIKLIQKINKFLDVSMHNAKEANKANAKNVYMPLLTKTALEFIALLLFISLMYSNLGSDVNKIDTIKLISVYAFALFRMLPMINKIFMAIQNTYSGRVNLENYVNAISDNEYVEEYFEKNPSTLNFDNIILKNINISYNQKKILDIEKFNIRKGDFIGIKGITGSGKTTFLELLMGLNEPDEGVVEIDGKNLDFIRNSWFKSISYVPQDIYLLDDTVEKNITFYRDELENYDEKLQNALEISEINNFVNSLEQRLLTHIGERGIRISGGQRQRIGIARALFDPKPLIIFDEATSSLDNKTEENIINNILKLSEDHTIVMVAHRESSLKYCSKIFNLNNHRLVKL